MTRKVRAYTAIGRRITELGRRQREIANVLKVSQQTVSKKLRGETAILLSDLEKLGEHYKVPLTFFFEDANPSPELTKAWDRVKEGPMVLREMIVLITSIPESSVERVYELAKFIVMGARDRRVGEAAGIAAEDAARYSK